MPNYVLAAERAARRYGIDPQVFKRLINAESGFREGVTSPAGARDIAQFIPSTARAYGVTLGDNRASDDLDGAARYLRDNLKRTGGNYHEALSIYNSGSPTGYLHIPETRAYVAKILNGVTPTPSTGAAVSPSSRTRTVTTPGTDNSMARRALISAFVQQGGAANPQAVQQLAMGLPGARDTPATSRTITTRQAATPQAQGTPSGVTTFDGVKVAAWIKPILAYARQHGWSGKVNSGYRTFQEQHIIHDIKHIKPSAVPGTSNHEGSQFPRGAVDVSNAAQLAAILRNSPYASKLIWAGGKDPVHFSHPHNGGY